MRKQYFEMARGAIDMAAYMVVAYFAFAEISIGSYDRRVAQLVTLVALILLMASTGLKISLLPKGRRGRAVLGRMPSTVAFIHYGIFLVDGLTGGWLADIIGLAGHQWSSAVHLHIILSLLVEARASLRGVYGK